MKKLIGLVLVTLACVAGAFADSYTYTSDAFSTATQWAVSSDIPVQGELDRVILWNSDPKGTSVVVIANYAGDTIADVIYTGTVVNSAGAPKIVLPRRVGTTTAGTALSAVTVANSTGIVTTLLSVPYEKYMLGGNTKVRVVDAGTTTVTNYLKAQFIFTRP